MCKISSYLALSPSNLGHEKLGLFVGLEEIVFHFRLTTVKLDEMFINKI